MENIYVRKTDDGDTLYCLTCKEEILHTEAKFGRLFKVHIIDLAKVTLDTDKECKANLNKMYRSVHFCIFYFKPWYLRLLKK